MSDDRASIPALFPRTQRLLETAADLRLIDELSADSTTWLVVEGTAGGSQLREVFDAFALYLERCEADARLLVVCVAESDDVVRAHAAERDLSAHLKVLHAADAGAVKAGYLCADVLVCIGNDAGVPALVDAMAIGTPVVAAAWSEAAATLGDAGLIWETADPALICASVDRLRRDAHLRAALRETGFARMAAVLADAESDVQAAATPGGVR
jgi:uncharacterized alpha-E superfamily protein